MINNLIIFLRFTTDFIIFIFRSFKVKVVFFFPFYHTGGAEKVHLDIVRSIGAKNSIVIFTSKSYNNHLLPEFKKYAYCFNFSYYLDNKYYRKLLSIVYSKIGKFNKLSVFGCNNRYYYQILEAFRQNVFKVDLLHAFSIPDNWGMEIISLSKVRKIDKRIVINDKTKKDFENLYKKHNIPLKYLNRIKIINNGLLVPNNMPYKDRLKDKLSVAYLGRISKEKRVHLSIRIGKIVNKIVDLKIYGSKEIDVPEIDQFYSGNLRTEKELNLVYENLDILLVTSYREGFPMVIMEAMSNGVVCVSTDVGGISEHITSGVNGFLVENYSEEKLIIDEFVSIIDNLNKNRLLLEKTSNSAYNYAKANFSIENFNKAYQSTLVRH